MRMPQAVVLVPTTCDRRSRASFVRIRVTGSVQQRPYTKQCPLSSVAHQIRHVTYLIIAAIVAVTYALLLWARMKTQHPEVGAQRSEPDPDQRDIRTRMPCSLCNISLYQYPLELLVNFHRRSRDANHQRTDAFK